MNAVWWSAIAISLVVLCGAWHNLITQRGPRAKRVVYGSVVWFSSALGLPLATKVLVPSAGPWTWLLVALAANGLLMIWVDGLLWNNKKH
jgi:hypothetical protein